MWNLEISEEEVIDITATSDEESDDTKDDDEGSAIRHADYNLCMTVHKQAYGSIICLCILYIGPVLKIFLAALSKFRFLIVSLAAKHKINNTHVFLVIHLVVYLQNCQPAKLSTHQ